MFVLIRPIARPDAFYLIKNSFVIIRLLKMKLLYSSSEILFVD